MEMTVTPANVRFLCCLWCRAEQKKYKEEGRRESRSTLYSTLAETEETKRARTVQDLQSEVGPAPERGRPRGAREADDEAHNMMPEEKDYYYFVFFFTVFFQNERDLFLLTKEIILLSFVVF